MMYEWYEVEVVSKAGIVRGVSEGGVDFNVVSKKLGKDGIMEWVSDVIYEEDEKNRVFKKAYSFSLFPFVPKYITIDSWYGYFN